jgi:hypothetical protein
MLVLTGIDGSRSDFCALVKEVKNKTRTAGEVTFRAALNDEHGKELSD